MKKLNESNYVIQRSVRSNSFVVHGDRLKPHNGKVNEGAWPATFLDAVRRAQDAGKTHDLAPDGQQPQDASYRRPGKSHSRSQLADNRQSDGRKRDRKRRSSPTSAADQPATPADSVPPRDTLTYSNQPLPGAASAKPEYGPIIDGTPRRSGRRRRPPAKLRMLVRGSHVAPGVESSTCSVNIVDNYCCTDTELASPYEYDRLTSTSSSSDGTSSSESENMNNYRCRDVRCIRAAETMASCQPNNNTNFVARRCSKCRDAGIETELFPTRRRLTEHTKNVHGCYYNPYGDRFIPIDPNQLAEGRARKTARRVEREIRQRERERPNYLHPEVVSCDALPARGRGRGVLRLQAAFDSMTPTTGAGMTLSSVTTPSVGRSRVLEVRETQRTVADPGRLRNTYPMPDLPTAPPFRFKMAAFPELTSPQSSSMRCVPLASAAAKPLFSVANPGATWLAAAPNAVTAADPNDRDSATLPSPARSVELAKFVINDTDDSTSYGPVETASTKVDGEQAISALSPHSSTSEESFAKSTHSRCA